MDELSRALKKHFGFDAFKPNQREIVEAIRAGRDVFAALPTGGGKSLCYQLPAVMAERVTLVVSPLIALMKDQVDGAREDGIPAAVLNSSLSAEEARSTWRDLGGGRIRLLYASPERLAVPGFRAALGRLGLGLIAVDEAHCISEWGHEFRPDYRSLGLLREEFPGVSIAAFTATATPQVQDDVIRLLDLRSPFVVRASFDRPEIFYRVLPKDGDGDAQVLDFVSRRPGQSGIVYRGTRRAVERTAEVLAGRGIAAAAYHAGLPDQDRRARQEAFVKDATTVIVATIAFGMGIDKSNVRWVVHADLPRSVEGYYQETGRAARDGEEADTLLLWGPSDIASLRWHIRQLEAEEERERAEGRLAEILRYVESASCRRAQLLAHFGERHPGACGRCDVCAGEVETEDLTEAARKVLSAAVRTGECFGGHHLADVLTGAATDKVLEKGHEALPTFGVGREHDRSWWLGLMREMEAGGILVRGEGRATGFRLSDRGRLLLRGKESFTGARRAGPGAAGGGKRAARSGAGSTGAAPELLIQPADGPAQEELFQWLRQVRKRVADARGLPPYVIFSDKSLRVMAQNRPTDPAALLRCHGVGDAKLAAYGATFITAIRDFLEAGGAPDSAPGG
jgi:ATP-dependent DNA helicase RecQ